MRRGWNFVLRSLAVVVVGLAVGVAAQARPREEKQPKPSPFVRILKGIVRAFGDGLVAPKP